MGNFGTGEGIILLVIIIVIYYVIAGVRNRGIIHLALNNFKIDPDAENQVIIEGRKTGLWQWILVQLKLGNIYTIKVHKEYISYAENSARGEILTLVPIKRVSSTTSGYEKPLGLLILAFVFALLGIGNVLSAFALGGAMWFSAILLFACAAGLVFWYNYSKNFVITIESTGSQRFGFSFKRSFIENVPVEIEQVVNAIQLINELVVNSDKKY